MKVLMLNGSPKKNGNTARALKEIGMQLEKEGLEYEIFNLGGAPIRDCIGCGQCSEKGCVFDDDSVNEFIKKAKEADGFIFGTPVYYAHPSGRILDFLDRVFFAGSAAFKFKPGAVISVARRGGGTASCDALNKYLGKSQMPIATSTYWNIIYGEVPGQAETDIEGMQTMRNLARNMAWMIKCFDMGKKNGIDYPDAETDKRMNFIR